MSVLQKLTEGIVERSLAKEGTALLEKWEKTGLLEGLEDERKRNTMAVLLENQAAQLLKEAASMAGGDVEGFAAVAFPIVRRVFGGLLANDIVSVQPMSLPSGLIFFLDFTFSDDRLDIRVDNSIYGGGVIGSQITGGANLGQEVTTSNTSLGSTIEQSFYSLNSGYGSPTGSATIAAAQVLVASAIAKSGTYPKRTAALSASLAIGSFTDTVDAGAHKAAVRYDPDLLNATSTTMVTQIDLTVPSDVQDNANWDNLVAFDLRPAGSGSGVGIGEDGDEFARPVRRLTERVAKDKVRFTLHGSANSAAATLVSFDLDLHFPLADNFDAADAIGALKGAAVWGLEGAGDSSDVASFNSAVVNAEIPEIDIKVDSIAVTAVTKKLKAKWTPELGQDLQAYHNLDAEVELTSILSEQIALEIDREILNDLVQGAKAGTYYWSRQPGTFVNRTTGQDIQSGTQTGPDFTGTVSEWYETLIETLNDVSANIHRKTLRGGANFIVVSPEMASILEFTTGFRASVTVDSDKGTTGAVKVGSLSKKWDIYVDPYFLRNVILIGRKGGSFLESGYVYAPYVPLQVTPTIFGIEDFVPRKGVMTRYAKKMVRADYFGLVIVKNFLGI